MKMYGYMSIVYIYILALQFDWANAYLVDVTSVLITWGSIVIRNSGRLRTGCP